MGRKKGTKLTLEQKEKAAENRVKKAEKINRAINDPVVKRKKDEPLIAAYGWNDDDDHVLPIFTSEVNKFKGRMFKTLDKARRKFMEEKGVTT